MSQQGWIKLHRQILESDIWADDEQEPFDRRSAWIDLLLMANHKDKQTVFDGKAITVMRGQKITSVRKLSERWRWSVNKTYRYLKLLEDLEMIKRESDSRRTLLTIVKYGDFQGYENTDEYSHEYTDRTLTNTVLEHSRIQSRNTNKNIKNIKNEKNDKNEKKNNISVYFPDDEALNDAFKDFVDMRKKLKKPLASDRAITLAINKLNKLSNGDSQLAIEIINQSVMGSWLSFYPLTERKGERPNSYMEAIKDRVNVVDSWLDDNDEGTV